MNPWLGTRRGYLTDWITQRWVRATGRLVDLYEDLWLAGPSAPSTGVGESYLSDLGASGDFTAITPLEVGLLPNFGDLAGPGFDPGRVRDEVVDFYERTSRYQLYLWSHWSSLFRPFGLMIDAIFARRLRQLQLPLSPLDTSRGVSSRLVQMQGPDGNELTGWLRRREPTGEVIYAGLYTVAQPPAAAGPCVKVVFPLPNGNASVFLAPRALPDGSLELVSRRSDFGGPGFYFVVDDGHKRWAKHVPQLTETIHVFPDDDGQLHTDHVLRLWGRVFLRLHYAMPVRGQGPGSPA